MQKTLLALSLCCCALTTQAQISITAADMPVAGDTLRHSNALATSGNLNLSNTGANIAWDYSFLTPRTQTVDQYKTATQVNPLYAATIPTAAYGYKVADSIPGLGSALPVSVNNIYTFFQKKTTPVNAFAAVGFGAMVGPLPTPAVYSDADEWYIFPLNYNNADSTTFDLNVSVSGIASLRQIGYRKTKVDGWGTIKTPYFTTPVSVIRVRSEVVELDSVTLQGAPMPPIPRHTVEYKWLASGEHYPALWVTANVVGTTETPTTVAYRDLPRSLGVGHTAGLLQVLDVYPNPAVDGKVTVKVPASWTGFTTEVFDMQGRLVQQGNKATIDLSVQAPGDYLIRIQHGSETGLARIVR